MNRHAVGAFICVTALGCASTPAFDGLGAADRALFTACGPALVASACGDGDDATKATCLEARTAAYGRVRSARMRRRWLIANGCSPSTLDAPATSVAAVTSPSASTDATPTAVSPAAEPAPPTAEPAQPPPPAVAREEDAPLEPPPASSPFGTPSDSPPPDAREVAGAPAAAVPVASVPVASVPIASAKLAAAPDTGEQRLRDIIVAHSAEMKNCVDRQLKLIPDFHAEGTLLIEVDAIGAVARVEVLGTELLGTPLESCLQAVAARWRFPRSRRAYRIDAPVRVFGTGLGH